MGTTFGDNPQVEIENVEITKRLTTLYYRTDHTKRMEWKFCDIGDCTSTVVTDSAAWHDSTVRS